MRDWRSQVDATWLGDPPTRKRVDDRVRRWMAGHRRLDHRKLESVAAFTVERAYSDMLALGLASDKWLYCTMTASLTMELILGARDNTILANALKSWDEDVDREAWSNA